MEILGKILIFIFSFCLMPQFYYENENMALVLSITLCVIIAHDLYKRFNRYLDGFYENNTNNMKGFYDDYNGYGSYGGYYGSGKYYGGNVSEHSRYMPKTTYKSSYVSNEEIVAKKMTISNERMEFVDEKILYKSEDKEKSNVLALPPIKEVVKKELEKKSEVLELQTKNLKIDLEKKNEKKVEVTNEVIMILNNSEVDDKRKSAYDSIIEVIKAKRYPTSKCCRLLKAFEYIDICDKTITIYTNGKDLEFSDVIPMDEIKNALRRNLHCYTLDITFKDVKCVSVFDFYIKNYTPKVI